MFTAASILPMALFLNALLLTFLSYYSWKNREVKGSIYFAYLMGASAIWTFASLGEFMAYGMSYKIVWSKMSYIGITSVAPFWMIYALSYMRKGEEFIKRFGFLVWVIPIITILFVFTNESHHLIWTHIYQVKPTPDSWLVYEHGTAFFFYTFYSYILLGTGSFIFLREAMSLPQQQRMPFVTLLFSVSAPWIANLIYIFNVKLLQGVDVTVFAFTLTGILISINVYKFKFLSIVPAAKELVYRSLGVGVVVVDGRNRVVDFNPVVKEMINGEIKLGMPLKEVIVNTDKNLEEILAEESDHTSYISHHKKWVSLRVNPLLDYYEKVIGKVIQFNDITKLTMDEKRLEYSRHFFADVIDSLYEPTFVLDSENKIVIWNKAMEKLSGYKAKDVIGKDNKDIAKGFYNTDRPILVDYVIQLKDKEPPTNIFTDIKRNGTNGLTARFHVKHELLGEHDWILSAQALTNEKGEVMYGIETIHDITEVVNQQKVIQKKLDEIQKMNEYMVNRELRMIELKKELEKTKKTDIT